MTKGLAPFPAAWILLAALSTASAESLDPVILHPDTGQSRRQGDADDQPKSPEEDSSSPAARETKADRPDPVQVDEKKGRVVIRAHFTGTPGILEFGACSETGKAFLSPLVVDARPSRVVRAMRKLGVEPGRVPKTARGEEKPLPPEGEKVRLFVTWNARIGNELVERKVPLEELFWNRREDRLLPKSPWIYAGGKTVHDEESDTHLFVTDLSGSVAVLGRADTSALFYYAEPLSPSQAWQANPNLKPPSGMKSELVVEPMEKKPASKGSEKKPTGAAPAPPGKTADDTGVGNQPAAKEQAEAGPGVEANRGEPETERTDSEPETE